MSAFAADVADYSRRYTDAGWTRQWARSIGLAAAVGIVYFLAARLSLLLLTKPDGVAVVWPASGVAAGVLIALGPRARLPVAAGAMVATIVANLMGDRALFGAVVFALCNAEPYATGRPRDWPMREIVNGIFYVMRAGCAWRLLPNDLPPWGTIYRWFAAWRDDGRFERINHLS